jgi:hypothetical protein
MSRVWAAGAAFASLLFSQALLCEAGAAIHRGGGASEIARTSERGVTVYRAPKPVESELAGGAPRRAAGAEVEIIVVECRRPPERFVRTQGFYSGHPGTSRRFTQGFWSGPVDLPKSRVKIVRLRRM